MRTTAQGNPQGNNWRFRVPEGASHSVLRCLTDLRKYHLTPEAFVGTLRRNSNGRPVASASLVVQMNEELEKSPRFDRRPWGTFTVLDEGEDFKVKRIEVLPGKRLSYQKHSQRAEHWVVVQGTAKVTLDDQEIVVRPGQAIDIAIGAAHRVENPGDETLLFIEVQRGAYLGEDDIVRLQDDFGRIDS